MASIESGAESPYQIQVLQKPEWIDYGRFEDLLQTYAHGLARTKHPGPDSDFVEEFQYGSTHIEAASVGLVRGRSVMLTVAVSGPEKGTVDGLVEKMLKDGWKHVGETFDPFLNTL